MHLLRIALSSPAWTVALAALVACSSSTGQGSTGGNNGGGSAPGGGSSSSGGSSSGTSSSTSSSGSSGGSSSSGSGGSGSSGASGSSGSGGSSSGSSGSSGGGGTADAGGSGSGADAGGTPVGTTTWTNGQTIASSVTIAAGATVTIDPGATVNIGSGVTITVRGTLKASSATTHAALTGSTWTGIVVASGGTLALDGVDLTNPSTALDVQSGAAAAEYDDGVITASKTPFLVEGGGALTTKKSTVKGSLGTSQVTGSLTASFLDYDSNGNPGITTMDPSAQLSVEDSTLHGSGPVADFLVSQGGASKFHVAYTNISNVHCAFHFDTVGEFDVSYDNIDDNAFGFMLYGSGGAGPFTVSNSNMYSNSAYDYDTQGQNSPITFDHCYSTGTTNPGTAVTTTNPQSAMVMGAGPR